MFKSSPFLIFILLALVACSPEKDVASPISEAERLFGSRFYQDLTYAKNPKAVALGREIFNEKMLSIDSTVSCGSCHIEGSNTVLAQPGVAFSPGVSGKQSLRNTPALINQAWIRPFFRDGGVVDLDLVALAAISNENEMNLNPAVAMSRIENNDYYKARFREVYGKEPGSLLILKSLSAYMFQFESTDTKYDRYKKGLTTLSSSELEGEKLFLANCNSCHRLPLTTNNGFANNGLPVNGSKEKGLASVTEKSEDFFVFKVPQLREVGKTGPYMYDGRFSTLEEVVNFYSEGMYQHSNIAPQLKNISSQGGFQFTEAEKNQLVQFLRTFDTALSN